MNNAHLDRHGEGSPQRLEHILRAELLRKVSLSQSVLVAVAGAVVFIVGVGMQRASGRQTRVEDGAGAAHKLFAIARCKAGGGPETKVPVEFSKSLGLAVGNRKSWFRICDTSFKGMARKRLTE